MDCMAAAHAIWSALRTVREQQCWDAAALRRRWYHHMNVIFTREQLGRLIDEFYKVLEHIPRYCELSKLVVHQVILVDRHNDVHVATAWCHFAANTLSDRVTGLSSHVWKHCIHSHQRRSADDWCRGLPVSHWPTVFAVQLSLDGCVRKERLHPCQQFWLRCRGHPDIVPLLTERLVRQKIAATAAVSC